MIEVRIPVPVQEYFEVRDRLEDDFNQHAIPVWISADCVIRTWAGLMFHQWFDQQGHEVDYHLGWGELKRDTQDVMLAAVSHDFVDETYQPYAVVIFHQDCETDEPEYREAQRSLAIMFKLAHGGA